MKRFGKVFLINVLPRLIFVGLIIWGAVWLVNYIDEANAATLKKNSQIVAEQQSSVDKYTGTIKASIAGIQRIRASYVTQEDIPTKNLITYDLVAHQSNCITLVKQYNNYKTSLPSYIKTESFTTSDCLSK